MELKESDLVRAEEINSVKALHTKSLQMMRKMFEGNTAELEERCKERLSQLEADLELRRKVSEGVHTVANHRQPPPAPHLAPHRSTLRPAKNPPPP